MRWSDEFTIEKGSRQRAEYVFRRPGKSLKQWAIQPTRIKTKTKKTFWAAFGWGIRTNLVALEGDPESAKGGVTSQVYLTVLKTHLSTIMEADSIFMHDNAPIHTAKIIKRWLNNQPFDVMIWPPYSPDLNPIENLWFLLKEAVYKAHPELLNMSDTEAALEALISAAKECWNGIVEGILDKLSDTMPHRVQAVLEAKGWYTKY